jgi:hypothetical protein
MVAVGGRVLTQLTKAAADQWAEFNQLERRCLEAKKALRR